MKVKRGASSRTEKKVIFFGVEWCAARGPAAITHYKPIQPRHSLLSFAFGLSFLGLPWPSLPFHLSINFIQLCEWIDGDERKEETSWMARLSSLWAGCLRLAAALNPPKVKSMGHQSLPFCCRASLFTHKSLNKFHDLFILNTLGRPTARKQSKLIHSSHSQREEWN